MKIRKYFDLLHFTDPGTLHPQAPRGMCNAF